MFLFTSVAISSLILEAYHVPKDVLNVFIGLEDVISLGIIQLCREDVMQSDLDLSIVYLIVFWKVDDETHIYIIH